MSRILVVSPCPTHPTLEGNARRILNLTDALIALGHDVEFLYVPHYLFSLPALPAMRRHWKDRLHTASPHLALLPGFLRKALLIRYRNFADRLARSDTARERSHLRLVRAAWQNDARNLCALRKFDVVIVEYAFLAPILRDIPDTVLKIIDTHDRFSDRDREVPTRGRGRWISFSRAEESRALAQAHVVLAIQDGEADHFRGITQRPVITVGHLTGRVLPAPEPHGAPAVLIVGSQNPINRRGLHMFLEKVWPLVRERLPDARLRLAGKIADRGVRESPGVERLGCPDDIATAYGQAHVVVNPVVEGTGLPVKSIEALAYGKPLVATKQGSRGIEPAAGVAFLAGDSPSQLAEAIVRMLGSVALRRQFSAAALQFAAAWNAQQERNLQAAISISPGPLNK